jgi:O-antigen ligase
MASPREEWAARVDRWRELATLTLVLAGAFAIPLVFLRDPSNSFALPKAILLRVEAILLASVVLAAILLGAPIPRRSWRDPWLAMPMSALAGIMVLTMTSTNRPLSLAALGTAAATVVVFLATVAAARARGWLLVAVPLTAAAGNAILVIAEETNLWMPFGVQNGVGHHLQCTALVGNPNEVGSYLGAAALACLAAMPRREAGWAFPRNAVVAVLLVAGLIASQTLTAIVAFVAAGFTMMAMSSWKKAIGIAAVAAVTAAMVIVLIAPFRERAGNVARWMREGAYNTLFTERFTSFAAAWSMFTDHPLTGVGPGVFAWQYYDYKIRAEQRFPLLRHVYSRGTNYGEVHNDHLQVLAEEGIAGYCGFAALLGALAWISFTGPAGATDRYERFARSLALPLCVFWVVLSIAQFPLETTVVRSLLIHLAAVCVGWRKT